MLESSMDLQLLHRAASAYYLDDLRQAEIAEQLGVSRPTVSKLISEAKRIGMVRFEVLDVPTDDLPELEARLQDLLGIAEVRIAPGDQVQRGYRGLGDLLGAHLAALSLRRGDVLLISSGRTTFAVSGQRTLPPLPGVVIAPTVGGLQEPDPAYQANDTAGRLAARTGAEARYIFAPALPSPSLWASLQSDPSFRDITALWDRARAVVIGVGAPYAGRESLTGVVPRGEPALEAAEGDICLHFYDRTGAPIEYPGSERLVRPSLQQLHRIPHVIALAAGPEKAGSIRAGARAGLLTTLLTDVRTARAVLADAESEPQLTA